MLSVCRLFAALSFTIRSLAALLVYRFVDALSLPSSFTASPPHPQPQAPAWLAPGAAAAAIAKAGGRGAGAVAAAAAAAAGVAWAGDGNGPAASRGARRKRAVVDYWDGLTDSQVGREGLVVDLFFVSRLARMYADDRDW